MDGKGGNGGRSKMVTTLSLFKYSNDSSYEHYIVDSFMVRGISTHFDGIRSSYVENKGRLKWAHRN